VHITRQISGENTLMEQTFNLLNLDALKEADLKREPFPYIIVPNLIFPKFLPKIIETFPPISKRGSFPLTALSYSGAFEQLIAELQHPGLRALIGKRLDMNLEGKPSMITVRGCTGTKDGQIHVDSESKLITLLLYLNQGWQSSTGRLRLLYDKKNLDHYAAEISPEAGTCLIFKVTRNCWHGHATFIGERRSIQLNYVTSSEVAELHLKKHRLSAFLKKILFKKDEKTHSAY
jgi:SM-20-related protein